METFTYLERILRGVSQVRCFLVALLEALIFCATVPCMAQDEPGPFTSASLVKEIARETLADPTSYAPATTLYVSARLDWNSSQSFFRNGSLEENPRYTISGLPHDIPLSYGAGNRRILMDALSIVLPVSFANNAVSRVAQSVLTQRDPAHHRRWAALGWIERTAVASGLSYGLSVRHFQQWQRNERLAAQLGY
jgi:hypothetical protein